MMNKILFAIFLYFLILVLLSRLKPKAILSKKIQLFRAFFPSWKFFEDVGEVSVLFHRVSFNQSGYGDWTLTLPKVKRSWMQLLYNPNGNYLLAAQSLLQHLDAELENVQVNQTKEVEKLVVFQLIYNLVKFQISNKFLNQSYKFQFKVCSFDPTFENTRYEDILISPEYEVINES